MARLLDELREDLSWSNLAEGRPITVTWGFFKTLTRCWLRNGTRAVLLYRLAYRLRRRGWRFLARLLNSWSFRSCHAEISSTARIAGGLRLPHPQGVIIGSHVAIGRMVTIGQNVTIGGNFGRRDVNDRAMPRIGDEVIICAGSVVGGPIDIGARTIIGANSVVTRSLPGAVVAGGIPIQVLYVRRPQDQETAREARWE